MGVAKTAREGRSENGEGECLAHLSFSFLHFSTTSHLLSSPRFTGTVCNFRLRIHRIHKAHIHFDTHTHIPKHTLRPGFIMLFSVCLLIHPLVVVSLVSLSLSLSLSLLRAVFINLPASSLEGMLSGFNDQFRPGPTEGWSIPRGTIFD